MPRYSLGGIAPQVADDAWIAPSADVIGDVVVEAGASLWFGAVARGDTAMIRIGAGSNVQDGAVLHADPGEPLTIGADVTVGHRAILHGCTVGNRVLIGMGATVLNGAVIADDCLVGAGALVTEGKSFPPGSLIVGVPAKAVRTLDDAAKARLVESARGYREKAARYAAEMREV